MTRITLPKSLEAPLNRWLASHPQGHERGAWVLFTRFDRGGAHLKRSARFVAVDAIKLEGDWVLDSSPTHLKVNLRKLPDIYLRCELEGLELGFIHSHPPGALRFSRKDDAHEQNILRGYSGSNGRGVSLVAMVLCDGKWIARVREGKNPASAEGARHVAVIGDQLELHLAGALTTSPNLERQEAAFGKPFNRKLKSLRIAVVGLGGTGSPIATLLVRAGVGELIVVDGDKLESSNLNRVRGYRKRDVGRNKAVALSEYITELDLGCSVEFIDKYLQHSSRAIDILSECDLVFGCTDDVLGRELLNLATYYYGLIYIDVGLTGAVQNIGDGPVLRDHRGRVSTISFQNGSCLRCQRVVTDEKLRYEEAVKANPTLRKLDPETLKREFYLVGGGESAPGVGPFTSAVADAGVAGLMDLIRPYRRLDTELRRDNIWYDFVHLRIYSNEPLPNESCFCCGPKGIRPGDERGYRLGLPILGKV